MLEELSVDFEWLRCPDGYSVVRKGERIGGEAVNVDLIVAKSQRLEKYRPVGGASMMFDLLLRVETEADAVRFVTRHGVWSARSQTVAVAAVLEDASLFRDLLLAKSDGPNRVRAFVRAFVPDLYMGWMYIVAEGATGMRPKLKISGLTDVFLWHACLRINGVTSFRSCRQCGTIFEVGPGTGKRADSTFCKPEHSVLFHSHKRGKDS